MAHKQSAFLVFGPSADRQGQTPGFIRVSAFPQTFPCDWDRCQYGVHSYCKARQVKRSGIVFSEGAWMHHSDISWGGGSLSTWFLYWLLIYHNFSDMDMDFYLVINVLYLGINKWILVSVQTLGSPPWSATVLRLPHGPHSPNQWLISVSVLVLVLFYPPPPYFPFFRFILIFWLVLLLNSLILFTQMRYLSNTPSRMHDKVGVTPHSFRIFVFGTWEEHVAWEHNRRSHMT